MAHLEIALPICASFLAYACLVCPIDAGDNVINPEPIERMLCEMQGNLHRDMMTSSNGNIFRATGPLCGEFTGPGEFPTQKPVTQSFDVFFDRRLYKRLSKQPQG